MNRISLDFDGTLECNIVIQDLYNLYVAAGREVFVLTSRTPEIYRNTDLYLVTDRLGIKRENIIFAFSMTKTEAIVKHNIDVHYDNDPHAVHEINSNLGPSKAILVHYTYINEDIHDG